MRRKLRKVTSKKMLVDLRDVDGLQGLANLYRVDRMTIRREFKRRGIPTLATDRFQRMTDDEILVELARCDGAYFRLSHALHVEHGWMRERLAERDLWAPRYNTRRLASVSSKSLENAVREVGSVVGAASRLRVGETTLTYELRRRGLGTLGRLYKPRFYGNQWTSRTAGEGG